MCAEMWSHNVNYYGFNREEKRIINPEFVKWSMIHSRAINLLSFRWYGSHCNCSVQKKCITTLRKMTHSIQYDSFSGSDVGWVSPSSTQLSCVSEVQGLQLFTLSTIQLWKTSSSSLQRVKYRLSLWWNHIWVKLHILYQRRQVLQLINHRV